MSRNSRIKPAELRPGDVFSSGGSLWIAWSVPHIEYAEWNKDGPIKSSRFWEVQVSGIQIIKTKPGKQVSHQRVVMTHDGPLMGIDYGIRITRRDDLTPRVYMRPHERVWLKERIAAAKAAK